MKKPERVAERVAEREREGAVGSAECYGRHHFRDCLRGWERDLDGFELLKWLKNNKEEL